MPSAAVLEQKKVIVAQLNEQITNSCTGLLVDYKGINVADDTKLRKELREAGVKYNVVKNNLLRLAIQGTSLEGLSEFLEGTTALATSDDDYVSAAKIIHKYASASKDGVFSIKSGYLDGEVIDIDKITSLAKLPSREVLLSMVANVFNAPIASFARAVQAIVDKGGAAPAEEAAAPVEEAAAPVEEAAAPAEESAE